MVNFLPAIIVGGPPHSGKSVLFYNLTQALRTKGIAHHAIRACPDGEGNHSQETEPELADKLRNSNKWRGLWSDEYVEHLCRGLSHRLLPMLVDMGGRPTEKDACLVRECTHAILLLREDDEQSVQTWTNLVEINGLLPLARLYSSLNGTSTIKDLEPIISGTLVGLERHAPVQGDLFDLLVERIAALFSAYSPQELEQLYLEQAPTELVINLVPLLRSIAPITQRWEPAMLTTLSTYIPADTALSVYGQGPGWLYAALAVHAGSEEFYQFDPRLRLDEEIPGWVKPPSLRIGQATDERVQMRVDESIAFTRLAISIDKKHLDYLQADGLSFPSLPVQHGLVLDGAIPMWLLTALARLYASQHIAWIACYQPQLNGAVVVYTGTEQPTLGTII